MGAAYTQKEQFGEFFRLGQKETISPFITPATRHWGANLGLKSSILAGFLLLLSFSFVFFPEMQPLAAFLLIGVYFLAGIPPLIESIEDLLNLDVNIDVLMTIAAFSSVFIGSGLEGGLLLVLFDLSKTMEEMVRTKASSAINHLHQLSPNRALVLTEEGELIERSVKEVAVGSQILVRSGQVVPLDGDVVKGSSSINLEHLTGEKYPVTKTVGDPVPAGAHNLEGALTLQVTRTSSDSTVARIIQLVTQAQESKPKLQRLFDRMSRGYASTIILLSALFSISFPFLLQMPFLGVEGSLYRALAFLIAASPCALIIAIPIAYLSAVSVCAKNGILLKGGIVLDQLAGCRAVAFDKTGTLTTGVLTCLGVERLTGKGKEKEAIAVAFGLERNAIHPIAQAISTFAKEQQISPAPIEQFQAISGYGLGGKSGGVDTLIGHPEFIAQELDEKSGRQLLGETNQIRKAGELVAALKIGEACWLLRFADTPRPLIRRTLDALKNRWGLFLIMLTGDHEESARRIAHDIGLDHYKANLKPEDKLGYVSQTAQKMGLAMVGDGINDAPALARATVGICMGKIGMTAAMEASDIVLLQDNIEQLGWLVGKARQTSRIVLQNLSLASLAIVMASLPALGGLVPLWLAVLLHEGGTVLVGLNALRLLRR